ncbi:hypothetical protein IUY40_04980 [Flavobacterium sp. ALJ2]|uniref:hypothetical protein n=1 Tax=Flavobacterium sp. ALJ2 TaxID=2786960 RepID=UPI0018A068A0|nr:hypothetical protein [Flavobacterium sp. ALJ2]MBF7090889.1 hypothetical protein [Flavobacterium sp. ALJ2]
MISKTHILFFVFLLGLFLVPTQAEACSMKSEKKEHTNENTQTKTTDSCCDSNSNKKEKEGCGDKCNHYNCRCVSVISILTSENPIEIALKSFNFSNKKQFFHSHKAALSSGFYMIWSPPKIS